MRRRTEVCVEMETATTAAAAAASGQEEWTRVEGMAYITMLEYSSHHLESSLSQHVPLVNLTQSRD